MANIRKGEGGYYHPGTEDEVRELILHAREEGKLIRVRGSGHSASPAIYTSDDLPSPGDRPGPPDDGNLNLLLDKMRAVLSWDDATMCVTVQAGCHLGVDPSDPSHSSTTANSLFHWLDHHGWALPDTGGISHQTVGGFLSTGSSGSSIHHSVSRQLRGLRIIDGTGEVIDLDETDERFHAAGVSLGLLGIIVRVTFQCVKAFNIWGVQTTTSLDECAIDLFGEGSPKRPSLAQFFQDAEHTRLMWWPQKGVDRMEVWKARTIPPEPGFVPHPYQEFPLIGSGQFAEKIGGVVLRLLSRWILPGLLGGITRFFLRTLYPFIVRLFEPVDGKEGPELFQDSWWHGLPMDNEADDQLMPIHFTEVWIPVERCREVMQALREVYAKNGIWASGTTSTEIYPTPASKFWMSPAYQRDVVKIDVFWFGANKGDPIALFYPQFWDTLKPFGFRAHWAKYLPFKSDAPTEWLDYLRPQYPRWNDFMALRARMDPAQVFVTDYWRTHLGIPPRGSLQNGWP